MKTTEQKAQELVNAGGTDPNQQYRLRLEAAKQPERRVANSNW